MGRKIETQKQFLLVWCWFSHFLFLSNQVFIHNTHDLFRPVASSKCHPSWWHFSWIEVVNHKFSKRNHTNAETKSVNREPLLQSLKLTSSNAETVGGHVIVSICTKIFRELVQKLEKYVFYLDCTIFCCENLSIERALVCLFCVRIAYVRMRGWEASWRHNNKEIKIWIKDW